MTLAWPYLTSESPGIPGVIKRRPEDFQVEELPLYQPCGTGDHIYVWIEKTGITTRHVVLELARALGVAPSRIGVAGRKDAHSIARQLVSVEGADLARVRSLDLPGVRVLDATRHRTKLRLGSLRGNRFVVRVRDIPHGRLGDAQRVLETLQRRGAPNYFGPQRFGMRGDTWEVGRLLLSGDFGGAADRIIGRPNATDPPLVRQARELAAKRCYREAADAWPSGFADCAALCRSLAKAKDDARRAVLALDRSVLALHVSAYQAWIFNQVVAARLKALDSVLAGDIVFSHATGLHAPVADLAVEQSRAARFECSATGPIVGFTMPEAQAAAAVIEHDAMVQAGCDPARLPRSGPLACVGGRRPIRFPLEELDMCPGTDDGGTYVQLCFSLPPGCYATVVLREICKEQLVEGLPGADDE